MGLSPKEIGAEPWDGIRVVAMTVAIALHMLVFLLFVRPLTSSPPWEKEKAAATMLQVNFIEPSSPLPPLPLPPVLPQLWARNMLQQAKPLPVPSPLSMENANKPLAPLASSPSLPARNSLASQAIRYNNRIQPRYPAQAIRQHHEGTVTLIILVGVDGVPKTIQIEHSSGYIELDRAATEAAKMWRFNPSIKNGQKVEAYVRVPVTFNLS